MAGIGESCSHMAALVFALDSFTQVREKPTCTGAKAYWKVPHGVKGIEPAPAWAIDFRSAKAKKNQLEKYVADDEAAPPGQREKKALAPPVPAPTPEELRNLFSQLNQNASKECAPSVLKVIPQYVGKFKTVSSDVDVECSADLPGSMMLLYDPSYEETTLLELQEHCKNIQIPSITGEQAAKLEELTREQNKCEGWFSGRAGRITASNMHAACHTNPNHPSKTVLNQICYPKRNTTVKAPSLQWGCDNETHALQMYQSAMSKKHAGFTCRKSGLHVSPTYPFLAASPDGMIECKCCSGKGCLEIKCPYTHHFHEVKEMVAGQNFALVLKKGSVKVTVRHDHSYYY